MTTLQKIKELLELGYEVEVEVRGGDRHMLFDNRLDVITSSKLYDKYDCVSVTVEDWYEDAKILRIIPKKPKLLEVGRKVKVVETGKVFLVSGRYNDAYHLVTDMNSKFFEVAHFYEVIPVYDEETETQETIEIIGHKYIKSEFEQAIKDLKEIK